MTLQDSVFKPRPKPQTKADVTTIAAKAIIENESSRRDEKTRRLRQERLALEAEMPPARVKPKSPQRKRKQ
jgi:hypothetical protein